MDFEGALRARLLAAGAITAIVGQRIYWEDRPQSAALPAITINYVIDARDQNMDGFQLVQRRLVQVDVWAVNTLTLGGFRQKRALTEAVIAELAQAETSNGIKFRPAVEVDVIPQNERTETQYIYRDAIRLTLFFSPA